MKPYPTELLAGGGLLREEESVFFRGVAPDRLPHASVGGPTPVHRWAALIGLSRFKTTSEEDMVQEFGKSLQFMQWGMDMFKM